jgi:hypothetical protein
VASALAAVLVLGALALGLSAASASDGADPLSITSGQAASFSVSPRVDDLSTARRQARTGREAPPRPKARSDRTGEGGAEARDPLASALHAPGPTPAPGLVFDGTDSAAAWASCCAPPDPTGDVGPNNYVQLVNATKVAIFNKSGTLQTPIFNLGSLWPGGDQCATNSGDPQVNYDEAADRWVLSQIGSSNRLCFAVSQTANPTGLYYLFNFNPGAFPDYFKVGVWSNGYYVSANEPPIYTAYAFDRAKMLAGDITASFIKIAPSPAVGNFMLPADVDGATQPSGGGLFYTFKDDAFNGGSDRIELFQLTPDFATPLNTTFALINSFPIAPFTYTVCGVFNFNCIRQPNTSQRLDAFSEYPMQRFAYRNLGPYQALVGNFTVDTGTTQEGGGIRWFELRNAGSGWTLFQEGTHDPDDGHDRFFGSIAVDRVGNIALGYSVSSSSLAPSIRYATRSPGDPPGTLQAEQTLQAGGGSQTGSDRWGDYSSMTVDPSDDCTFWYTNEYYSANAATDWKTKIGNFVHPECLDPMPVFSVAPATIDFGYQAAGTSSPPQALTVTNTGQVTADLTISSVGLNGGNSGDFGILNDTCSGASVAAGETCTMQTTFTPTGSGARATALRFTDDAAGSPHDVTLTGTGVSNAFTFGKLKRNTKKGTATLSVKLPGPGNLTLGGKGVKRAKKSAAVAGAVKLKIRPTGKKRMKLRRTSTVKLRVKVTYAPTGGTPASKFRAVKLKLAP